MYELRGSADITPIFSPVGGAGHVMLSGDLKLEKTDMPLVITHSREISFPRPYHYKNNAFKEMFSLIRNADRQ